MNNGVPRDYRDLMRFHGFGPKCALVTVQASYRSHQGIATDSHVCKDAVCLGFTPFPTLPLFHDKAEAVRASLESLLPTDLWGKVNNTLGSLGQLLLNPSKRQLLMDLASTLAQTRGGKFTNTDYGELSHLATAAYPIGSI